METKKNASVFRILIFWLVIICLLTTCDSENNSVGGLKSYTVTFDADNGTSQTIQTIIEGNTVNEPITPTKVNNVAGLYFESPPDYYTFNGWFNGDTKWDFNNKVTENIILKVKWIQPSIIDLSVVELTESQINRSGDNIVTRAFRYVSLNPQTYTLLLDENVETVGLGLGSSILTIIGIGEERIISHNGGGNINRSLIQVSNGNLIIGQNIILKGIDNGTRALIWLDAGCFTMLPGSKITGHTAIGETVYNLGIIYGYFGTDNYFTMEGGEISGNNSKTIIFLNDTSSNNENTFTMNGGVISNNNGIGVGIHGNLIMNGGTIIGNDYDVILSHSTSLFLSGNTIIGKLELPSHYSNFSFNPITISGAYSGTIYNLDLSNCYASTNVQISRTIANFENKDIIKANPSYLLTEADIEKFSLGNFIASYTETITQLINDTHKLELDNVNNVIKLVVK